MLRCSTESERIILFAEDYSKKSVTSKFQPPFSFVTFVPLNGDTSFQFLLLFNSDPDKKKIKEVRHGAILPIWNDQDVGANKCVKRILRASRSPLTDPLTWTNTKRGPIMQCGWCSNLLLKLLRNKTRIPQLRFLLNKMGYLPWVKVGRLALSHSHRWVLRGVTISTVPSTT